MSQITGAAGVECLQIPARLHGGRRVAAIVVLERVAASFLCARQRDLQYVSYEAGSGAAVRRFGQAGIAGLAPLGRVEYGDSGLLQMAAAVGGGDEVSGR